MLNSTQAGTIWHLLQPSGQQLVVVVVTIIVVAVVIVVASFLVTVVMMALGAIGASGPFGFLGVGIAVYYLYQLIDGHRPLVI